METTITVKVQPLGPDAFRPTIIMYQQLSLDHVMTATSCLRHGNE
jgi:hypothetical protein